MKTPEPHTIKSSCKYCANAPTNHKLTYIGSVLSIIVDPFFAKLTSIAPRFLRRFVDWLPSKFFMFLSWFGLATFSDDIEKTVTFRSRVVWEEALRRGIRMEQVIAFGKPLEIYRALIGGKWVYFESLPVPPELLNTGGAWDDKSILKRAFRKNGIPVPEHVDMFFFSKNVFDKLQKPIIVKPRVGSRGRHTTTNIQTFEEFKEAVRVAKELGPYLIVEEHLEGYVCRATTVDNKLVGFYRGGAPEVTGDGKHTIEELIKIKNESRQERVSEVEINDEIKEYINRSGYNLSTILPKDLCVRLTYRTGRFFGGQTSEMLDTLHPSFVPILERAGKTVDLVVSGFDCIIPDPKKDAASQRWGIIECNSLPFIDLHYYALEGKPRNISGMIWDLWDKKKSA